MTHKTFQPAFALVLALFSTLVLAKSLDADREQIHSSDPRNASVSFTLNGQGKSLGFCVQNLNDQAQPMDVFRIFLQTAEHFKDRDFEKVSLCFRKENRFVLDGRDFKVIGQEFGVQNPAYTIRTFPEKLSTAKGEAAFETHQGGLLYLMRVQMADFNEMHSQWYLSDLVAEREAAKDVRRPKVFAPDEEVF